MATAPPPVPYAPWDPPSALIAPASPPLLPQFEFRTGLECQDEYSYSQLPTQWFGAQEASLLITALINAAVCTSCLALFLLLHWCSPSIRARIYQPLLLAKGAMPPTKSAAMPSSAAYPPRVWRRGLRWLLWPPRWSADCEYTLELCMMIRFLSMNFRLFSLLAPFAFCIILPVYGVDPPDIIKYDYLPPLSPEPRPPAPPPLSPGQPFLPPAPPAEPPDPSRFKTSWGGLEALSLTHLPPGSQRFYAPVVCMWFFTLLLLAMLNHEWPVFARLRHAWLEKPAPHTYAVLVRAQPASTSAAELQSRLAALFPGEVEAVMPLRRPTREMREYELTGMWTPRAPRATRAGQRLSTQRPGSPTRLRFGSHHQRGGSSGASLAAALRHAPRGGSTPSAASGASTAAIAVPGGGSARAGNVRTDAVTAVPREPYYLALVVDGGVPLLQPRPRPDRGARTPCAEARETPGRTGRPEARQGRGPHAMAGRRWPPSCDVAPGLGAHAPECVPLFRLCSAPPTLAGPALARPFAPQHSRFYAPPGGARIISISGAAKGSHARPLIHPTPHPPPLPPPQRVTRGLVPSTRPRSLGRVPACLASHQTRPRPPATP